MFRFLRVIKVLLVIMVISIPSLHAFSRSIEHDAVKILKLRSFIVVRHFSHKIAEPKKIYTEDDIVSFPKLETPVDAWPQLKPEDIFVPPAGKHYRHNYYNMNLYEPAKELFGHDTFQKVTSDGSEETYLFPGKNYPRLIKDFAKLPFSASGSLWAYRGEEDYERNIPCWSGSASLLTPFCAITAAHCLQSSETEGYKQPGVYAFVLHHYGEIFATKKKCVSYKVSSMWRDSALKGQKPRAQDDYGLVFFLPIHGCVYDVLNIRKESDDLTGRQIQVTGYPGDSVELRARKLWPDNVTPMRTQYLLEFLNRMPFGVRKIVFKG